MTKILSFTLTKAIFVYSFPKSTDIAAKTASEKNIFGFWEVYSSDAFEKVHGYKTYPKHQWIK